MLNDVKIMIDYIKELSSLIYGKDVFFYDFDDDRWYSRDHCRVVEFSEIIDWMRKEVNPMFYDSTYENINHVIKYRQKNTGNSWVYKEIGDANDCLEFLEMINAKNDIEYQVFVETDGF